MSNHNGNANKMVNDTPRTYYAIWQIKGGEMVCPEFARQLERELNAANAKIKQLEDNRTKAAATSLANMLAYEDAIAKIKRLEEAGTKALFTKHAGEALEIWNKAKEAKP